MGNLKCIPLYALIFQHSSAEGRGKNCPQTLCDSSSFLEHQQAAAGYVPCCCHQCCPKYRQLTPGKGPGVPACGTQSIHITAVP